MTYISNALQSDATEAQITTHVANLNAFVNDSEETPVDQRWKCVICLEGTEAAYIDFQYELARSVIVATNCLDMNPNLKKHYFHKSCIKEMVLPEEGENFKSPNCPICLTQKAFTSVIPDILRDNVNGMSQVARTNALVRAAYSGLEDSVAILLEAGCSEEDRKLALIIAAAKGHGGSVSLLLEAGCSEEHKGWALCYAAKYGHEGLVNFLLEKGSSEEWRGTSLGWAAKNGHEDSVGLLLEAGCSEEKRGVALVWAAENGREGSLSLLLDAGCSKEHKGWALRRAAWNGREAVVGSLLEAGCSEYYRGWALCLATANGVIKTGDFSSAKLLSPSRGAIRGFGVTVATTVATSAVALSIYQYLTCSVQQRVYQEFIEPLIPEPLIPEPGYFDSFSKEMCLEDVSENPHHHQISQEQKILLETRYPHGYLPPSFEECFWGQSWASIGIAVATSAVTQGVLRRIEERQ